MQDSAARSFQVIVVGGGPVGMATACDLGVRGIRVAVVEPRELDFYNVARVSYANGRTMEHFRRWGIADKLRENDIVPDEVRRDLIFVTRANGKIIFKAEGAYEWRERMPIASDVPEWTPLPAIEKTLRDKLLSMPNVTYLAESSVIDFTQDETGVSVRCEGAGGLFSLCGSFIVIANGAHSRLRRNLNLRLKGETLFRNVSWYFRSPALTRLFDKTQLSSLIFFLNEDAYGDMVVPQGDDHHYNYLISPFPDNLDPNDWSIARKMLFDSIGEEFEIEEPRGWHWGSHSRMTPTFNFGRALLAGDAAHLTSPFGGFGMNMGIGDAADIGWKVAAVLNGWGGPRLLETYTMERREAAEFIIGGSAHNNRVWGKELVKEHMEEDSARGEQARADVREMIIRDKTQQFRSLGAQFGYRYTQSPIIVDDGTEYPELHYGNYTPSAAPGCRAPHIWLEQGTSIDKGLSLYDHFGDGFCLLKLDLTISTAAIEAAANKVGLPLTVLAIDNPELNALYERKLALIRPDHHVAWRGDTLPEDCDHLVDIVRGSASYR